MLSFRAIIDRLKSNFLLKKFKTIISTTNIFTELNDIANYSDLFSSETELINFKFDNISSYISKKNNIDEINTILKAYYRWYKINPNINIIINARKLLCAWLIYYTPSIIIGDIDTHDKYNLVILSQKIIIELTKLSELKNDKSYDIINFNKILNAYSHYITLFLEKDKIDKINYYSAEWISLQKSYDLIEKSDKYDNEQKEIILKNIINDQKLIEKYMDKIMKNFDYDRLKLIIKLSNNMTKKIIENYKIIIEKDICDKEFNISVKILDDIKKFILIFNRKNIDEINERIDPEYFINLIKNNILSLDDIKIFGDFLIIKLCEIGSKSNEDIQIEKWNNIKNEYYKEENKIYFISELMIFSLDLISIIKDEISNYDFLLKHIYS